MERHYLLMEQHVQKPGGEKQRVEAQPTEGFGLYQTGAPPKVSEKKRNM